MRYLYEREDRAGDDPVSGTRADEVLAPGRPFGGCASRLRVELGWLGRKWAVERGLAHEVTRGGAPAVLFREDEAGEHGNFLRASYRAIAQRPEWARRLTKAHTMTRRALLSEEQVSRRPRRSELDSSNSSDALLMNVFCHPKTLAAPGVRALLGVDAGAGAEFGFRPRIPFRVGPGRSDCTEIDLRLGDLLIEAKLTEFDFQTAPRRLVERYAHLEEVFDLGLLDGLGDGLVGGLGLGGERARVGLEDPELADLERAGAAGVRPVAGKVQSYQLIRGVLAAHAAPGCRFCVLCDARRPDLVEAWHRVMMAVRDYELRSRLLLLTWQELAAVLPQELQVFLRDKYGILKA